MIEIKPETGQGVKEQIKAQIKALVRQGALRPGQALPSARNLAQALGVNRNTTWAAYKELAAAGWLVSATGQGTRVAERAGEGNMAELEKSFADLLTQAGEMGLSWQEAAERFRDFAARAAGLSAARVLVVECNQEGLDHIARTLAESLGIAAGQALIQNLAEQGRLPRGPWDLIVCGYNHLAQLRQIFPRLEAPVMGLMLKPDMAVMSELLTQPPEARVGMVCINHLSTLSLFRPALEGDEHNPRRPWAGLNEPKRLQEVFANCPVVYASSYAYPEVARLAPAGVRVKQVELTIDQAGVMAVANWLQQNPIRHQEA